MAPTAAGDLQDARVWSSVTTYSLNIFFSKDAAGLGMWILQQTGGWLVLHFFSLQGNIDQKNNFVE